MNRVALRVALVAVSCAAAAATAATGEATVAQPRAFGYVIGDIVTQRVLLEQQGHSFTPASLPAPGSLGNWVERHASRIERDAAGREWLTIEYQVMNSPQTLTPVTLPSWKLKEKGTNGELQVPEWQITVGPLSPEKPFDKSGLGALRPDRAASLMDVTLQRRWIRIWTIAAVVLLLAWLVWWVWRGWRASRSQPFAKALREIRDLDDESPHAWYALHRAFDATAARVVQRETLPVLFERAPQLAPQRAAIERFLDASLARFFNEPGRQAEQPSLSLKRLCADLRQIEKRYER